MLLCQCHRVSHRAVDALLDAGAHKVGQIVRATRAGTDCGACIPSLRDACRARIVEQAVTCSEYAEAGSA